MTGASDRSGDTESNPIILSPPPKTTRNPTPCQWLPNASAQSPPESQLPRQDGTPMARSVWDSDVEMTLAPALKEAWMIATEEARVPSTLSFACRSGWDLNNKEIWSPAAGFELEDCFTPDQGPEPQLQEPVFLGVVSFKRASKEDTEAFMSRFLYCAGDGNVDSIDIQQ
ncbi:hypothetical protein F5Y14DRAFT_422063 [Nemania sp. NC0429]|nr:hypothetical protein F5Y14DRAFT_422063 [Nemania sp. NC0429]